MGKSALRNTSSGSTARHAMLLGGTTRHVIERDLLLCIHTCNADGCGGICARTCAAFAKRAGKKAAGVPLQCQNGTCVAQVAACTIITVHVYSVYTWKVQLAAVRLTRPAALSTCIRYIHADGWRRGYFVLAVVATFLEMPALTHNYTDGHALLNSCRLLRLAS